MDRFKLIQKDELSKLPEEAGVYAFKKNREFLYIGKAVNIRERVKNHFSPRRSFSEGGSASFKDNLLTEQTQKIGYIETGSEIEALLLEADLIKKYRPKYNIVWKDNKNYFYVAVTKEELPKVFITHQIRKIQNTKYKILNTRYIGPFVDGKPLKQVLKILRRIFPYYTQRNHPKNLCPWCHMGLCPGPSPDKKEYKKNIKNLISILKGEKQSLLKKFRKEMEGASKSQNFEKAAKIRDQILALERVFSHAKIFDEKGLLQKSDWNRTEKILQKILNTKKGLSKIEAYDVSNIQGKSATGSMVAFIDGRPDKNLYRKFKIKIEQKPNDTAMIKETLSRRLAHAEWKFPDLMLIDGGKAQLNIAIKSKFQNSPKRNEQPNSKNIKIASIAKRHNELFIEGLRKPVLLKKLPREIFNLILQLRDEAHRFAISYHKKLREEVLLK